GVAYRTASIHDLDGSATGIPDSYILIHDGENDSIATDDSCVIQPSWNAAVCTGDVGRLSLRAASVATGPVSRKGSFNFGYLRPGAQPASSAPAARAPAAPPAPPAPIVLLRNGKEFRLTGNQSTVRAGTGIQVITERPEVSFSLSEMDKGSWVMFELPGFSKASGTEQASMQALQSASETSWF